MKKTKKLVWWGPHRPNLGSFKHQKDSLSLKNYWENQGSDYYKSKVALNYGVGGKHTVGFWNAGDVLAFDLENNYITVS